MYKPLIQEPLLAGYSTIYSEFCIKVKSDLSIILFYRRQLLINLSLSINKRAKCFDIPCIRVQGIVQLIMAARFKRSLPMVVVI